MESKAFIFFVAHLRTKKTSGPRVSWFLVVFCSTVGNSNSDWDALLVLGNYRL